MSDRLTANGLPTVGAFRAATWIANCFFPEASLEEWKTCRDEAARIIDRETHFPEVLEAAGQMLRDLESKPLHLIKAERQRMAALLDSVKIDNALQK